jgi:hypothetical protein
MKLVNTFLFCLVVSTVLAGCYPPAKLYQSTLDPLALQQMQTQDFDTPKEILFASTMSVFQDSGFTIEASDLATGFITAKSPTRVAEIGWNGISNGDTVEERTTAFVETTRPNKSRVRLNFIERSVRQQYGAPNDIPNEDPAYYEKIFNKIREAIFLREAYKSK